jgi:RNase H-fold protein (predicted Holliday junction resolvase)
MQEFFIPKDLKQVMKIYRYRYNLRFLSLDLGLRKIGIAISMNNFIHPIPNNEFFQNIFKNEKSIKIDGIVVGLNNKDKSQILLKEFLFQFLNENNIKATNLCYIGEEFTTKSVYQDNNIYPATFEDSKVAVLLLTTFFEILARKSHRLSSNLN